MRIALVVMLSLLVASGTQAADCTVTSSGLSPVAYVRSAAHLAAGLAAKAQIVPRDASGQPSASGKMIHLAIGSSLMRSYFGEWQNILAGSPALLAPGLLTIRAAEAGATTDRWADPTWQSWANARTYVGWYGAAPQVQSAHVHIANIYGKPITRDDIASNVRILKQEYPNVRAVYVSGAPYPYEGPNGSTSYGVQMPHTHATSVLLAQMVTEGTDWPAGVWVDFLDLWSDGTTPNPYTATSAFPSGLSWACADLDADGYHPSLLGATKAGAYIQSRLREDPVAGFLWSGPVAPPPPPPPAVRTVTVQGSADGAAWVTVGSVTVPMSLPLTRTVEP